MPNDSGTKYPKPVKILSKSTLSVAWKASRDSTNRAGAPGYDGQTARSFASNLDQQLDHLVRQFRSGEFGFGPLRPRLIPKSDGVRFRLICIPNVRDRLVQRAIAMNLGAAEKFGVAAPAVFGFVQGRSLRDAIKAVLNLRATYSFVFETDIESFFDRVNRSELKSRVKSALGVSSLVPLIHGVIDCEVKTKTEEDMSRIVALGVVAGKGLRQGMPLSPALANLTLAPFDKALTNKNIPFVRYADDIVTFASSRSQARDHAKTVKSELAKIGLTIPELSELGKSRIVSKFESFSFLGREFYFSEKWGDYQQRVSKRKISAIVSEMLESAQIENLVKEGIPFSEFSSKISRSAASYRQTYSDASNAPHVDQELRRCLAACRRQLYEEMFGKSSVQRLSAVHRKFLGLDDVYVDGIDFDDFDEY